MADRDLKIRLMFAGVDRLSGVLDGIQGATRRAGSAMADTNRTIRQQQTELRDVQRRMAAGTGNVTELINRERTLTDAIDRGNRELEQRRAAFERLSNAQRRFETTQARGDKLMGVGGRAMAAGAVVGAGAGVGVKGAMDMEESMAGVKKVTNMDNSGIARMSADFLDMSTRIPMAASGLAEIAAAAGAAGVGMDASGKAMKDQRQQLIAFTEDAAKMGVAFDMTAEDAGGTMAKWRTAFAMTQPQVRALGDQVNALTNTFGGKASDVADIVTKIGPLGKVAGLAAPQIAALGSTLNSIGVQNEVAATGIKNMMLTLTKGTAATKGQSAAFKALGLDSVKVSKDMQKDASGTIVNVMERIKKLQPAQRASMLSELFGTESVSAIAPLLTNLDGLKTRLGLVGDVSKYTGSMQGEFLSRISTTKGATGLALNSLQALNVEMGQKLLPYVVQAAKWISTTAGSMRAWAKENPAAASGLMKLTATIAGLLLSFGAMGVAVGGTMKVWGFVRLGATMLGGPLKNLPKIFGAVRTAATFMSGTVMKAGAVLLRYAPMVFGVVRTAALFMAKGVMRAGAMMLANPMVLAIVAIGAAIGVLAYLIYTNWDAITAAFFTGVEAVKGILARLGTFFMGVWDGIKAGFATGVAAIGSVLSGLAQLFSLAWAGVKIAFAAGVAFLGLAWAGLRAVLSSGIAAVAAVFAGVGGIFSRGWAAIKGAFTAGITALSTLLPSFKNIGSMMLEGLLSMLSPGRLIRHIWNMGTGAIGAFKRVLGIHSPSRVFAALGGHLAGGLAIGIDRGADAPLKRTRQLANQLAGAMAVSAAIPVGVPAMAQAMSASAATRVIDIGMANAGAAGNVSRKSGSDTISRGPAVSQTINVTIQVMQQPGEDAESLARRVKQLLDDEARSRRLSSFADTPDYG